MNNATASGNHAHQNVICDDHTILHDVLRARMHCTNFNGKQIMFST